MANTKDPRSGSSSEVATTASQDLYPTSDIRFVMLRIGELSSKVDRLIDDVGKQGTKIDNVNNQISFVKGAMWVIGFLVLAIAAVVTWYATGKMSITFGK
jgi:hypothetical protein